MENYQNVDPSGVHRLRMVGIMGSGRSGSTLLEFLLAGHLHGATPLGELEGLIPRGLRDNELCSCGLQVKECLRWQALLDRLSRAPWCDRMQVLLTDGRERWISGLSLCIAAIVSRIGGHGNNLSFPKSRELVAHYRSLLDELSRVDPDASLLIDNSKTPLHFFALAATRCVDLHIVQLVRRPQAVVWSWRRRKRLPETGERQETMEPKPMGSVVLSWTFDVCMATLFRLTHPDVRFMTLAYEDLCADPLATLARCAKVFALSGKQLLERPTDYHVLGGNPARFERFTCIRIDDEWEHGMDARTKLALDLTIGTLYRLACRSQQFEASPWPSSGRQWSQGGRQR